MAFPDITVFCWWLMILHIFHTLIDFLCIFLSEVSFKTCLFKNQGALLSLTCRNYLHMLDTSQMYLLQIFSPCVWLSYSFSYLLNEQVCLHLIKSILFILIDLYWFFRERETSIHCSTYLHIYWLYRSPIRAYTYIYMSHCRSNPRPWRFGTVL